MDTVRRQLLLPSDAPTGRGVRIAILDTGIDLTHDDLKDRIDLNHSRSYSALYSDLTDRNGHGTHIAGIIGGTGARSNGFLRGLAPESELVVLKIASGKQSLEGTAIAAIEAAMKAGAQIINYSHGFVPDIDPPWLWPEHLSLIEEAFTAAARQGILCVVAAGNRGPDPGSITRPGGLECVLTVGAVDRTGTVEETSSRGPYHRSPELRANGVTRYDRDFHQRVSKRRKPDVVAPGKVTAPRCLVATKRSGADEELEDPDYVTMSGSSQATAVVSGLAAIILGVVRDEKIDLGRNPGRTLHRLLLKSARQLKEHRSEDAGEGLVIWPNAIATLRDFANDAQFRDLILNSESLRLLG